MLFNSLNFIAFYTVVLFLFYILSPKYRWLLLLAASYYFYACWKIEYAAILLSTTLITYITAFPIQKGSKKKLYLFLSIVLNLGHLFYFKYLSFFLNNGNAALQKFNLIYNSPSFKILIPVGISFYIFKAISYSIDVYRGVTKPEKHFGIFALYVSFFPELFAGPIDRASRLLPQFKGTKKLNFELFKNGMMLMLWGYYKKVVIADRLAPIVDRVFDNPLYYNGFTFTIATLLFAIQIYCDFSGYTDIASGVSRTMGIDLSDNFNRPYSSESIIEFWKRWHISLSYWLRDYVYIPLGGNRVSKFRWYWNLFITFLICGFWHGAQLTFIIWGCIHGIYAIISHSTKAIRQKIIAIIHIYKFPLVHKFFRISITFLYVCFAWIFFRAHTISDAFQIIRSLPSGWDTLLHVQKLYDFVHSIGLDIYELLIISISIFILFTVHTIEVHISTERMFEGKPLAVRWILYYVIIFYIVIFGKLNQNIFIYFQF
jgi:alginate O-acetyltransferase complex protein AlgI